jgi:hypothetical protein
MTNDEKSTYLIFCGWKITFPHQNDPDIWLTPPLGSRTEEVLNLTRSLDNAMAYQRAEDTNLELPPMS